MAGKKNQFNLSKEQISAAAKAGREKTEKAYAEKADVIAQGYSTSKKTTSASNTGTTKSAGKKNQFGDVSEALAANNPGYVYLKATGSKTGGITKGSDANASGMSASEKKAIAANNPGYAYLNNSENDQKVSKSTYAGNTDWYKKILRGIDTGLTNAGYAITSAAEAVGSLGDSEGGPLQELWYMLGGDKISKDNPLKTLKNTGEEEVNYRAEKSAAIQDDPLYKYSAMATESGAMLVPTIMSGGATAATGTTVALTSAANYAQAGTKAAQIGALAKRAVSQVASRADAKYIFASTAGSSYNEAKQSGADDLQATVYALLNGANNAVSELGGVADLGGLQKLIGKKGEGNQLLNYVMSVGEEILEEIYQGATGRAFTSIYQNVPLYSTTNDDAIFNPNTALDEATGAAVVTTLLGIPTAGVNTYYKTKQNNAIKNVYGADAQSLVSAGLEAEKGTTAHNLAEQAQQKLDNGKTLSAKELRELVQANEETFGADATSQSIPELAETTNSTPFIPYSNTAKTNIAQNIASQSRPTFSDTVNALGTGKALTETAEKHGVSVELVERVYNLNPEADTTAFSAAFDAAVQIGQENANETALDSVPVLSGQQAKIAYAIGQSKAERSKTIQKTGNTTVDNVIGKAQSSAISLSDVRPILADKTALNALQKLTGNINLKGKDSSAQRAAVRDAITNYVKERSNNEVHLRDSGERSGSQDTRGQVRKVEEVSGLDTGRRGSQKQGGNSAAQSKGEKVSFGGVAQKAVYSTVETEEMKKGRAAAAEKGYTVRYFEGASIRLPDGGYARGIIDTVNKVIYVRSDHPYLTPEQIINHEFGHDAIDKGEISLDDARAWLKEKFTDAEIDAMIREYREAYKTDEDEYIYDEDEAFEEIVCDALGGINIFENTTHDTETYHELFDEIRAYSTESKSNSTRGPPKESGGVKYDRDAVSSIKQQIKNAADKLNAMDVVAKVKTPDLSKMNIKQQRQWAESFLKSTGYVVDRKSFGKIEFTPKHINEGLNYVNSPAEVAAFAALPRVLKRGIEIDSHVNHKGRQRGSVTIAAPVEVNGVRGNMAVAITITAKNHYHAHRLVLPDGSEFTFDIEKVDPTPAEAAPNAESSPIKSTSESRITDSNGKVKASRETDAKYMAAVESGDMVTAQKMVDEAARKAGYSSEKIYHGTNSFGFTKIKTTGVEPGVEWSPFFATNNIYTAMTYSGSSQKTEIGKTKRPKKSIIGLRREAEALLSDTHDATTGFIRANTAESYIDRYGSIMDEKSAKLIKAGVEGAFAIDRKNTEFRFAPLEEGFSLDDYKTLSGNYSLYANTKNFLIVDGQGKEWNRLKSEYGSTTRTISKNAEEDGYSGVLIKNVYDTGMDWDGNVDEDVELASDVYIFFSPEAQVKSADPVTYDDNGDVIPLSKRFNSKNEDIRYSLEPVKAIQPKNSEWERSSTTDEVRAKHPNLWAVDAESSESRNPTQISGTVRSYRKIYDALKAEDFNGTVLDASSGLGYGTRAGIEEYGFKVDDIEPFPDSTYKPKYTDYSKLNKKYDVIISNAVLNVLPQDQRDALVVKMGQMLNDGGRIFINVRGDDVRNASSKVAINEDNMEYFISNTGSYQKGFTKKELTAYLQDALGDEFTVVPTSKFGKVSAVVTKKEHVITLDNDYKGDISPESGSLRFSLEENENIKAKSMAYFRKNRDDISHISQKQLESANEIVDEMVDYMKPYLDKANNKGKRYLPEEILGDTRFQNGSYGRTIENTTICFRTLAYIDFTNDIKERIGRPLTVEESFLASQMLYDIAKEPQCLYCYVSLDRKAYDEFLLKYIEQRDGIVEKINALSSEDKDAAFERVEKYEAFRDRVIEKHNAKEYKTDKERNAAIKKEIETYIKKGVKTDDMFKSFLSGRKPTQNMQERYNSWVRYAVRGDGLISAADLTTEEKRSKIKADGGVVSEQVADAESYAQSASWAKKLEQYRAYNGEILSMSNDMVETLNSEYGLRFYSFSEYTPAFIVENMQQIRDASLKGFKGLAYTKKPDFARIFAPTGMNINISVFGRMDGGKVVPDTLQGADWAEVQELRKQYDNVGAVFVATTDEMVDWALEQDWIDVVIPFHIVRTGANVAEFYKWINHTSQQSDRVRKSNGTGGKKADITPPEHNNDYETYKKLIEKRKLVPRFEKWYKDPRFEGAKYMKLVNETRQPASKTPKLKPNFDKSTLEAAKKSFNTFVDEGGYYGDWYEEGVDYNEAVNTVVNDINRGVRANEVEYGRQDVDWTKAMENRGKNRQHGQKLSREVTAENYKTAEKYFGTTYNIREAGYICPDGKMLDFSGRHDGGPGGYRTVDHRELADALGVDYGGKSRNGGMIRFINEGNIRIVPEKGGIDLSVAPTEAQRHMLARYVASFRGEVILDIGDADGNAITSVEYPKDIPASFVLKDIDGYFDKGKVPEPFTSGVKYSRDTTVSYDYSKPFAEQVDDWIAGKIPKSDTLIVSGTPKVFAGIGMPSLPFTINSTHVDYALNGAKDFDHELGEDLLKQLPEAIKKPVAIMTSKTKASASVVAMLEIRHNGKQVVVPVSVTGFGYQNGIQIDSNAITSIYGKRYSIANVLRDAIQEESNGQFRLYYLNEKKATELLQVAKVPMPKMPATRNGGFIHSLTEANSPVKLKIKDATESQQFKRWFGKSKIVNADGTPRVVYHQTSKVFTVFNTDNPVAGANDSETPNGIFFKQNDHDIGIGGDIQMAVYLRMEKPLHFKNRKEANAWYVKNIKGYGKLQDEMNVALAPIEKEIDKLDDKYFMDESISEEEYDSKWNTLIEKMRETENGYRGHLRELLNDYFLTGESGYDGIELDYDGHRYVNGEREDVHTYIVFDGTQVKSATDNIGTYDRNNSDIHYSREPETLNELRRQNRMLRERVDYWKGQTKPAKEKTLNKNDVHKLAMQLKEIEPTDLKTSEIEIRLNQLGRYILNTKEIRFTDVAEMAEDLAWDIVDNMSVKTEAPELELHNDIKSYMQSIVMHDDGSSEYRDIRRRYKNKRYFRFDTNKKRFEKSSLGVDSVYAELRAIYGEGLFPSDIWNVYDQLEHIAEVLDRTKGSYVDENNPEYQERQYYAADAVEMLRNSIIDGMLSEDVRQTAPTYAEKADAKLAKQKYEDSQKLKQAKAEGGQKLAEQKTEYDKLLEAQRKELNDRREREVKDVRDAKDKQIARIRKARDEKITRLIDENDERIKAALKKERKRSAKVLQEYRQRVENRDAKREENAERTKYKKRIEQDVKALSDWLLKPDHKNAVKHIPGPLQETVKEFIGSIDFTSKRALKGGAATKADMKYISKLEKLYNYVTDQNVSGERYSGYLDLPPAFENDLNLYIARVNSLARANNGIYTINQMTADELEQLSKIVKTIRKAITDMNKFYQNAVFQHAYEAGASDVQTLKKYVKTKAFTSSLATSRLDQTVMWKQSRPVHVFSRFGEGGKSICQEFIDGQNKFAFLMKETIDFANETYTSKEAQKWGKESHTFEFGDEQDPEYVTLTTPQIMSLYMLNQRDAGRQHLETGGLIGATHKGKGGKLVQDSGTHKLGQAEIHEICQKLAKLDAQDGGKRVEVAEKLQKFMAETGGEWGNWVSVKRFDVEMSKDKNYFPIEVYNAELNTSEVKANDSTNLYQLLNMGFTKELSPKANQAVVLSSIFDVFANHMSQMAQYRCFALPVLDTMKWLNYSERNASGEVVASLKNEMRRAFGTDAQNNGVAEHFITHFVQAISGTEGRGDNSVNVRTLNRVNRAAVAYNTRVMIQQPSAIVRAALYLNPVDLAAATKNYTWIAARKNIEEMQKYSGIAVWKDLGFYDVNVSRGLQEMIKHDQDVISKANEVGMKGAELMDRLTWAAIWGASKKKVSRETELTGEEYYKKVAEVFDEVIYNTQVVDSPLTKSEFSRDKSFANRLFASFMSEPMTTMSLVTSEIFNIQMKQATGEKLKASDYKRLSQTITVVAIAAVVNSALAAIIDAWRDDDDYATFKEKWLAAWKAKLVDELNPLTYFPIASTAWDFAKSLMDTANMKFLGVEVYGNNTDIPVADIFDQTNKALEIFMDIKEKGEESKYTKYGGYYKVVSILSKVSGIPAYNIMREISDVNNNLFPDHKWLTYDAGETSNIKYAFEDGYLTEDEAIEALQGMSEDALSADEAWIEVNKWKNSNDSGTTSDYVSVYDAIDNDGDIRGAVKDMQDHGKEDKDIKSALTRRYKDAYIAGDATERAKIRKALYATGLYGSANDVVKKCNDWLKDDED